MLKTHRKEGADVVGFGGSLLEGGFLFTFPPGRCPALPGVRAPSRTIDPNERDLVEYGSVLYNGRREDPAYRLCKQGTSAKSSWVIVT